MRTDGRTGYKGDPREILHFAAAAAAVVVVVVVARDCGVRTGARFVCSNIRNRKRGVYGPLPPSPHAVKRTWKEGGKEGMTVKDIEHGRPCLPLLNCYVLKTNAARAVR